MSNSHFYVQINKPVAWMNTLSSCSSFIFLCLSQDLSIRLSIHLHGFLQNIWSNRHRTWKPGCRSATSSRSTRRGGSWRWTDWAWTSTRIRSPLSSATTEPEKQPPCKWLLSSLMSATYVIPPELTCWLTAAALSQRPVFSERHPPRGALITPGSSRRDSGSLIAVKKHCGKGWDGGGWQEINETHRPRKEMREQVMQD